MGISLLIVNPKPFDCRKDNRTVRNPSSASHSDWVLGRGKVMVTKAQAKAAISESDGKLRPHLGGLEIATISRQCSPVVADENGTSLGGHIDKAIHDAVNDGNELHEIRFYFDPSQWAAIREYYGTNSADRYSQETGYY